MLASTRPAFSLTELMVSLAVVLVLATLVLPCLARSRNSTRTTGCMQNLRQLGLAANLYNCDSGRLPSITSWLYSRPTSSPPDVASGQLYQYLKSRSVYLCPGTQAKNDAEPSLSRRSDHSYLMNCVTCHARDLSACLTPTETAFLLETTNFIPTTAGGLTGPIEITPPTAFNPFLPGFPHRQRANFLMIDGHVHKMTPKEMNAAVARTNFWFPNEKRSVSRAP